VKHVWGWSKRPVTSNRTAGPGVGFGVGPADGLVVGFAVGAALGARVLGGNELAALGLGAPAVLGTSVNSLAGAEASATWLARSAGLGELGTSVDVQAPTSATMVMTIQATRTPP
jgi:hypothetical protein